MKVYTKTGDRGETSLIGGKRVLKNNIRVESYGAIDELISSLGIVRASDIDVYYKDFILNIQDKLMNAASILAAEGDIAKKLPKIDDNDIEILEKEIDRITEKLPLIKYFVLPGGNLPEAYAHMSRSICRRAERVIITMIEREYDVPEVLLRYINRLSDFLFSFARLLDVVHESGDMFWIPETE